MKYYYEFEEIKDDFLEVDDEFTLFIVDQKYYLHRGHKYLQQFLNSNNWISSDKIIKKRIDKILEWIEKNIPHIGELIKSLVDIPVNKPLALTEAIVALSKIFGANVHRAAGPEVIDPIIIEEGKILTNNIAQLVALHKGCNYRPSIIIILKDDDFERAKTLLCKCPNGMNVKMIHNDGEVVFYKVINTGADNIDEFLECYSKQCFSTCSKTDHNVLLSESWSNNNAISRFSPTIFQIRSTFLNEHKLNAIDNIKWLDNQLSNYIPENQGNKIIRDSFICMNKLFQVYCNDCGGEELNSAYSLAKELDNEILLAHVYRYSHFFNCSRQNKQECLQKAENVFMKYNISDHAIYCRNNRLIHQFSSNSININEFCLLEGKATYDTPGLALMAHIINNVGVAYLFELFTSDAIDTFNRGLSYAKNNHIQQLALRSNRLCANCIAYTDLDEKEVKQILNKIFTPSLGLKRLTFLTAQFALNVLSVVIRSNPFLYESLLNEYKIVNLIQTAFDTNIMGTGSMIKQLEVLTIKYPNFNLLDELKLPNKKTDVSGIRLDFICQYGLNPFFFNTWL